MNFNKPKNKIILTLATLLSGFSFLFFSLPAHAALPSILPTCARAAASKAPPSLNCMLQVLGNIAKFILGVTGSVTLLVFVYAGFLLLIAGAIPENVKKAKDLIKNALIGLAIIIMAGYLIDFGLSKLGITTPTVGTACGNKGVYVLNKSGAFECVESCTGTYACTTATSGKNCIGVACSSAGEACCEK